MKKWVFWLGILLLLGYIVVQQITAGSPDNPGSARNQAQGTVSKEERQSIEIAKDRIYQ